MAAETDVAEIKIRVYAMAPRSWFMSDTSDHMDTPGVNDQRVRVSAASYCAINAALF